MNVYVIGSAEFEEEIKKVAFSYNTLGNEVKCAKSGDKVSLIESINERFKIISEWAELVVVVPKTVNPEIKVGFGPSYEIEFAKFCDKPVVIQWFS